MLTQDNMVWTIYHQIILGGKVSIKWRKYMETYPGENGSVYTRDYRGSLRVYTAVFPRKTASDRTFLASFRGMPTPQPA